MCDVHFKKENFSIFICKLQGTFITKTYHRICKTTTVFIKCFLKFKLELKKKPKIQFSIVLESLLRFFSRKFSFSSFYFNENDDRDNVCSFYIFYTWTVSLRCDFFLENSKKKITQSTFHIFIVSLNSMISCFWIIDFFTHSNQFSV